MQSALDGFSENIRRVHLLHSLHASFSGQVMPVIDLSDLLRAEVVLAVSALDYYVHELTRIGMLQCWRGERIQTNAFKRFQMPIGAASALLAAGSQAERILENEIRSKHNFATFQQPEKIADAVRLFSDVPLWDSVGTRLGTTAKAAKASLGLIIDRRNKIAHEADIDPSYPGQRWPIDRVLVQDMLQTIERTVYAIHVVCM